MKKIGIRNIGRKISHKDTKTLRRNYFFKKTYILGAFVPWWQKRKIE
jgi:hypothetical protein